MPDSVVVAFLALLADIADVAVPGVAVMKLLQEDYLGKGMAVVAETALPAVLQLLAGDALVEAFGP